MFLAVRNYPRLTRLVNFGNASFAPTKSAGYIMLPFTATQHLGSNFERFIQESVWARINSPIKTLTQEVKMISFRKVRALSLFATLALVFTAVFALSAVNAMAQATTGSLRGVVTDVNGAVVPGASVTGKNGTTGNATPSTPTTGDGVFELSALSPGVYTITIEATKFNRSASAGVPVKVGIVNPFDAKLEA